MEKLKRKLKNQSGESLAETLVSLLIAALALVMLAGAMAAASSVITKSRNRLGGDDGYYSQTEKLATIKSVAESQEPTPTTITMEIKGQKLEQSVLVTYEKNETINKTPVIAYKFFKIVK